MAASVLDLKFTWENNVNFELLARWDAGTWATIIDIDENAHLSDVWPSVEAICKKFLEGELLTIGREMKA